METYLTGEARILFDAWHAQIRRRYERDLTFAEIRKGVQALSSLYVARRGRLATSAPALEGAGKRAAFVLYYAPLHFLAAHHVAREIEFDSVPLARLWDLGCGVGAAGAGWATAARAHAEGRNAAGTGSSRVSDPERVPAGTRAPTPKVIGTDRSGFALEEAEATYRAFGLRAETRRIDLGGPQVRPGRGGIRKDDAVLLAYTVNEMAGAAREALLRDLAVGSGTSRPLLVLEPIARKVAPWWSRWEHALGEEALLVHSLEWRRRLDLPEWIAEMDRAAGLDHSELTARVLGLIG